MPEGARARRADLELTVANVHDVAARLKQQSRFLCRRSDRLRDHSNDLLTVAMFQRLNCRPTSDDRRAHLTLLPYLSLRSPAGAGNAPLDDRLAIWRPVVGLSALVPAAFGAAMNPAFGLQLRSNPTGH